MKDVFFEVYAPLEYIDQRDKKKKIDELKIEILEIMEGIVV